MATMVEQLDVVVGVEVEGECDITITLNLNLNSNWSHSPWYDTPLPFPNPAQLKLRSYSLIWHSFHLDPIFSGVAAAMAAVGEAVGLVGRRRRGKPWRSWLTHTRMHKKEIKMRNKIYANLNARNGKFERGIKLTHIMYRNANEEEFNEENDWHVPECKRRRYKRGIRLTCNQIRTKKPQHWI